MASQSSTPIPKTVLQLMDPLTGATYNLPAGLTVRLITYLAKHQAFFDDKETTGNFMFSLKDGNLLLKNDIAIQA